MKFKITIITLFFALNLFGQNQQNSDFNKSVKKWFKAWELVSKEYYKLDKIKPTEFVLFDDRFVYTTSIMTGKNGEVIEGPSVFGEKYVWTKKRHNDTIVLPDGQKRKVEMMCFSIPIYNNPKLNGYFVMPLINYWQIHNIGDHGIGYEKLTTGVFVHEFCHSQQFENGMNGMEQSAFDKYFTAHENEVFMDDIMQDIYKKDSVYIKEFKNELQLFTKAFQAKDIYEKKSMAKLAFLSMQERHKRILNDDNRDLKEIDQYWLTMEGVAQYSSLLWLTDKNGGKLKIDEALKALKTASWSQEEGLAIVYLYSQFKNPKEWSTKMFRSKTLNILDMLRKEIE